MAGSVAGWPKSWVDPDQAQANNLQEEEQDDGTGIISQLLVGGKPFSRILAAFLRSPPSRSPLSTLAHTTSSVASTVALTAITNIPPSTAAAAASITARQFHHQLQQRHVSAASPLVESLLHQQQQQLQYHTAQHQELLQQLNPLYLLDDSSFQQQTSSIFVQPFSAAGAAAAAQAESIASVEPSPLPPSNSARRVVESAADVVQNTVDTVTTQIEGLLQPTVVTVIGNNNTSNNSLHRDLSYDGTSAIFSATSSTVSSSSITTSSSSSYFAPSLHRAILKVGRTAAEAASDAAADHHQLASISGATVQTGAAPFSLNSASATGTTPVGPLSPLNATLTHDYVGGLLDGGKGSDLLNATFSARPTAHVAYNDNANSWWRNFIPRPSMSPEEVRAQYYATYDPMTGVRIAATLGAIMSLFALFLIFKARCKSIRSRLNL
ncbi:uncharacterized protein LOC111266029 [Varroa jacobsoni]|uniref:uncharacterized protein LOC111266029 n=1 Tax=Varroa jacobsoni TaxID=62625 RepID=UPI000BF8CD11|nr:uncharacterized protein LOC111266029 [Varroa jacobsoni]XP_022698877.1 uncharacterized protein LOC111266029 [Varroa jacobsoni]